MTTRTVAAIGALADPNRHRLYEYVTGRHDLVSREEAAEATGIPLSRAKFHLDRLVRDGLLATEFRRLSGRSGPGAGRPAKLYRRAAEDFHASFPPRQYDVMGGILAAAVEQAQTGTELTEAIGEAAYARGSADAASVGEQGPAKCGTRASDASDAPACCGGAACAPTAGALQNASSALEQLGFEPEAEGESLLLHNCPFDALANDHRTLVCTTNTHYVQGVLDTAGAGELQACLDPAPGYCCVVVRPDPKGAGGAGNESSACATPTISDDHVTSD